MSCPAFIAECLALRTATHMAHLLTKSYAEHVALGDFYETLTDLVDKFAEVYMGLTKQPARFPAADAPTGTPVAMLEDFLVSVKDEFEDGHDSQALLNILAEIEELTARTLYKLKNFR